MCIIWPVSCILCINSANMANNPFLNFYGINKDKYGDECYTTFYPVHVVLVTAQPIYVFFPFVILLTAWCYCILTSLHTGNNRLILKLNRVHETTHTYSKCSEKATIVYSLQAIKRMLELWLIQMMLACGWHQNCNVPFPGKFAASWPSSCLNSKVLTKLHWIQPDFMDL